MKKRAITILNKAGYYRTWTKNAGEPPETIKALAEYASTNPGLDPRDYGYDPPYSSADWHQAYKGDSRLCTKQFLWVKEALRECYLVDVTDRHIIEAAPQAYSGRLEITQEGDTVKMDYCPGQYAPTEYRAAVSAVLRGAVIKARAEAQAEKA